MNAGTDSGYFWPAAVLMIVVASWVLYRYVAPKGWKEWQGAGLVQAFIIALYAEMYGFPLTLYVLTGAFGLDIPIIHMKGHLWSTLLGYGTVGNVIEMIVGYAFVFFGLGLLIEGWREVYRARQEEGIVTGGLYDLVRHPQYTGIFVALFGQLVHWPTIPTLVLFPVIVWVYVRLARTEEQHMIQQFGEPYLAYRQRVPAFFPKWDRWRDFWDEAQLFSSGRELQERSGEGKRKPTGAGDKVAIHQTSIPQKEKQNGTGDETGYKRRPRPEGAYDHFGDTYER